MRAGGGRAKGSSFERKVASMIVCTFEEFGITKKDCYRTPLSGGHVHASGKDPGDLCISPKLRKYFNYCVECKSYRNLDWPKLLSNKIDKGHWTKWWRQVTKSAGTKKQPLLVFQQNRSDVFVMVKFGLYEMRLGPMLKTKINGDPVIIITFSKLLVIQRALVEENDKNNVL